MQYTSRTSELRGVSNMPSFTVYGHPATKGSTVSFLGSEGRIITKADCKTLAAWSQAVAWAARAERVRLVEKPQAVALTLAFTFTKPKSVTDREAHIVKPDLDKLIRAILDALTGVAYTDDAQVVSIIASKCYGAETMTAIRVEVA